MKLSPKLLFYIFSAFVCARLNPEWASYIYGITAFILALNLFASFIDGDKNDER